MVKIILAENPRSALEFCRAFELDADKVVIVRGFRSLEGLRFRYEDVVRVPGWSKNPDIEQIEDLILRTHISSGPSKRT